MTLSPCRTLQNVTHTQKCVPCREYAKPNRCVFKCFAKVSKPKEEDQQAKHSNCCMYVVFSILIEKNILCSKCSLDIMNIPRTSHFLNWLIPIFASFYTFRKHATLFNSDIQIFVKMLRIAWIGRVNFLPRTHSLLVTGVWLASTYFTIIW